MEELSGRLDRLRRLNKYQQEILELVCQGHSYQEIADILSMSVPNVQYHMSNVYVALEIDELPRAPRQRELGQYCPLLSYLSQNEDLSPAVANNTEGEGKDEQKPAIPSSAVLMKVIEDEKALVPGRSRAVEEWTPAPPVPNIDAHPVILTRRQKAFMLLGATALAGGLIGAILVAIMLGPRREIVVVVTPTVGPNKQVSVPLSPVIEITSTATRTATPTVTQTPRPPTPTVTPLPPMLPLGDTWENQGLALKLNRAPVVNGLNEVLADFTVTNRTGLTLDFKPPLKNYFIMFSNGTRYVGKANYDASFFDFKTNTSRDFYITFDASGSALQREKAQESAGYYIVGVDDFSPRLPKPYWRIDINR